MLKTIAAIVLVVFFGYRAAKAAAVYMRDDPARGVRPVAGPAGLEDLRPVLEPIRAKHKMPAMGGAIIRGEGLAAIGATGVRKAGGTTPVTPEDRWHIGSCTKAMTATLIGVLVEEGTLSWGTSVGEFFRGRGLTVDAAWDRVTLRHLLVHRGGAPADLSAEGLWARLWEFKGTPRESRMELARAVLGKKPAHEPGAYEYSNAGFAIAGAMAEEATGGAWEDLMRARIFGPLGMTESGFGAPGSAGAEDQPWGHTARGKAQAPGRGADNPAAIGPGGSVHATIPDWSKFIAAHLGGEREGATLLKPGTYTLLHTPAEGPGQAYGGGWVVAERAWAKGEGSGRVLTHSGSNTMWYAVVWIAPERDLAVLVTCNQGGDRAARACDQAVGALIEMGTRSPAGETAR